ncbi:MAG: histidine--tRNA ligase [Candidatus Paracaedibacteraceae bacterium]|nr:histidine--tRNA ligase [Candidatus Paracaedibacteraceae bacterium]
MTKLQPVRGTRDLLDLRLLHYKAIQSIADETATLYGYAPIETPIFEYTSVFTKPLGETSDIVGKEMYTFNDRGGESITLRPEGTAPVVRAIMSEGLTQTLPQRRILQGPMFRYERPQKGRYRQFYQISIECVGITTYHADVEVISMAHDFLSRIGVKNSVLHLNTLGDMESRLNYRTALIAYFEQHKEKLSEDSRIRLEKNPLRILDSKDPDDKALCVKAPKLNAYLNTSSSEFFEKICLALKALGIKYHIDENLVRGMDYYCHTVFEFKSADLGAQDTLLGGGRYDGLMEQMGGPSMPAVGWACGLDRLALLKTDLKITIPTPIACIIPFSEEQEKEAMILAQHLRTANISSEILTQSNIGKRLKAAVKKGALYAVIIGEDEVKTGKYTVKDLKAKEDSFEKELLLDIESLISHVQN